MQHDRNIPLVDQLADASRRSQDPMTQQLMAVVMANLDDHTEDFFCDPSSEKLQALVGLWTRAVKLLKDTPEPAPTPPMVIENQIETM